MAVIKRKRTRKLQLVLSSVETALELFRDHRFARTDVGNAEYFAARFGDQVRWHAASKQWRYWNGTTWEHNDVSIQRCAVRSVRDRQLYAGSDLLVQRRDQEAEVAWAQSSESAPRLAALLALASKMEGVHTKADQWDADPWLLGVANGVVDLRTGEHRAMVPEDLIYRRTHAAFDPEATCPRFRQFLGEVFPDEPRLPRFLQRLFGYGLTGLTVEHVIPVFWGTGRNGKTRLINAIEAMFGTHEASYAGRLPFNTFVRHRRTDPAAARGDLAGLHGKRFVTAVEGEEGARFDTALIKLLTGEDAVTARFLYSNLFTFRPTALLGLVTNFKPVADGSDAAFWARLKLIPFTHRFSEEAQDKQLETKLAAEVNGILLWAIEGCLAWQRDGLRIPACIETASKQYQQESDPLREFYDERCEERADAWAPLQELFEAYWRWAEARHMPEHERLSIRAFRNRLVARFGKTFASPNRQHVASVRGLKVRRVPGEPS